MKGWRSGCTIWVVVAAAFAARAQSGGASGPRDGGHALHAGAPVENLFVSPCGQPFRAGPGEPYPVVAWFRQADSDRDGFLGRDEFRNDAAAFFAVLDRNHDGVIDSDEVRFYEHEIVPEILQGRRGPEAAAGATLTLAQFNDGAGGGGGVGGGGGGGGGHGGGRHGGGHAGRSQTPASPPGAHPPPMTGLAAYGLLADAEPVTAADLAFNGRITLAEFLATADRRFEALDVQGQGLIALSDLPRTEAQEDAADPSR